MNNYNYESVKSESGGAAYASSSATKNYSQADLGQNPTVNLATGRLRYAFADLSVGSGNYAVNVNHVYASSLYAPCAGKFNNVFGRNWKLNLSQCVICEGGRYYYMDESGEIHRFLKFDANRYHDVRNAKTVLTKQTDGYVIADGVGNKLYFNSDGLLCKSVSCHNDAMVKRYEYDSNGRLIRVYDNRLASNKIELNYEDNKLSCITSYSNNKKLLSLRYAYEGDNLVSVHKVAYTRISKESISKQILAFAYNGAYLSFIADCETKSAQRYEYASGKVSKVTQGAMTYNGLTLGSCDASNSPLSLGAADCSPLGNETFVPLKWNEYAYPVISDGMSVETDVTNENGITLAYFIDGNACITSSFEKMPDGKLKTLTKQGAKRTDKLVSNTTSSINGNFSRQASGEIILNLDNGFNLYRNHAEKSYNIFSYSFWLNISNTYAVLEAELTCKFKDNSEYVNKIYVDSTAKNAWQKIVIPFSVPTDSNGKPIINNLKTLSIKLFADKSSSVCYDSFLINEIGFAPSAMTKFRFFSFDKSFYLPDVKFVTSGNSKYVIDKIMYFTENDVLATLANKKTNNNFDIICCNGTQRFANFQEMYFSDGINRSEVETNMVDIVTNYPDDKTITLNYVFGDLGLFLTIYVSKNTSTRESSVTSDYHNNILKEVSEYNVTKEYSYDDYGRLITVKTTGFNKAVTLVTSYHYDSEGRLINSHDELDGQRVDYTDYGQISKIIECQVSDNAAIDTTHSVENKYGVFKERLLEVSDCDGEDKLSGKKITYENGRIRTVSDGVAKYGVAYNLTNSEVSYTQFNPYGNEELLQQDKITHVKSNGAILQNRHCSQFYNDGKQKDKITTETDKYNRVTAVSYQTGQNEIRNHYDYSAPAESDYAAVPKNFTDAVNNLTKEFSYDVDNNLVGWTEKENGKEVFKIQRIADGITKTCFGTIPYTFSVTQYDNPSVINPRVASTDFCFNQKDEINVGGLLRPFFNRYEYDGIGRIARKYSEYNSGYTYKYGTGREQKLLVGQDYNNYVDTKNPSSNYEDPDVTLSERMYPDYAKLKTVSKISYNDLHDSNNKKTVSIEATHLYNFDKSHRLTKDSFTRVSSGTTTRRVSDYSYCPDGRLSSVKLTDGSTGIVLETKYYTYDKQGRLSGINDGTSFGYDSFGNRTKQTRFGDSTFYEYKYGGNLHKVKRGSTVVAEYGYNENGVRLKKLSNGKTTRYMLDGNKILGEITGNKTTYYVYDLDGLNGFARIDDEANEEIYIYVRDTQNNIVMLTSIDKRMVARYEYDSFGNCTVYGEDGRINADPNFIGNINPFRWKSFYYDTETGLYYANGSYYDPKTGLYVDASPLNTVIENAFTTVSLDRNAPVCNNILEFAGNPYTIEIATDLHPDPTYQLQQDWLSKVIIKISSLLNKIDIGVRLLIASVLFVAAIFIGYNIGGAGLVCKLISDVIMGVGIGVVSYGAIAYLSAGKITSDGLAEAAVNAFLFASLFAFVYAGVNGIRYLFRTRPTVIDGVEIQLAQQSDFTSEAWDRIQSLQHRADGSTISSLRDGRFIHKGFKTEFLNNGKEAIIKGYGRVDCIIGNTLYELKPNNAWSIMRGISQLHRYNVGMGGGYKLVLVLY